MVELSPARPEHAAFLSELTYRAKASHGYDTAMMEIVGADCGVSPEHISPDTTMLAVENDIILGFAHLQQVDIPDTIYLEDLFIEPTAQGRGIGKLLFAWAEQQAVTLGYTWLEWESDPNAAPFYEKVGGTKIKEVESDNIPGRMIPIFHKRLTLKT